MATIYSFTTGEKKTLPIAELAPGYVKVRLTEENQPHEVVWVNVNELDGKQREQVLRQPPFDAAHRKIFRKLKDALDEVHCLTLEQWELGFRCDTRPELEIAHWRWLAETYRRITVQLLQRYDANLSSTVKQEIFRLLLTWMNTRNVEEVLATTLPMNELTEEEAREILKCCKVIPAEFFGGNFGRLIDVFRRKQTVLKPKQLRDGAGVSRAMSRCNEPREKSFMAVLDFAALGSLLKFKEQAAPANAIWAVDWSTGDVQCVYGWDILDNAFESGGVLTHMAFAVDFESDMLEVFLASVGDMKGHYYWNQERHAIN